MTFLPLPASGSPRLPSWPPSPRVSEPQCLLPTRALGTVPVGPPLLQGTPSSLHRRTCVTLFPSKVPRWERDFHTSCLQRGRGRGATRCPGASGAGSSLGQVGAGPASRGGPGLPCTPAFRRVCWPWSSEAGLPLTDLGLPAADPSLCSSPPGLARRFGSEASCSRRLWKPSPVSSAPPRPACSPSGPSLGLGPLGLHPLGWILGQLSDSHQTGAQGPQGVGTGPLAAGPGISIYWDSIDPPSTPHGHSWRKARLTLCPGNEAIHHHATPNNHFREIHRKSVS